MRIPIDKPPIHTPDCSTLELRIHVLGYYPRGESILIVLYNTSDQTVLQSILVDCYEVSNINKIEPLLKQYHIDKSKLTYFIWTHPDEDHSVGIKRIVKDYIGKETQIFVPYGLTWHTFNIKKVSLKNAFANLKMFSPVVKSFIAILGCSRRRPGLVEPVMSSSKSICPELYGVIYKDDYENVCDFIIEFLTPIKNKTFTRTVTNTSFIKNDISISFNLKFGNKYFFFGGDVENDALSMIKVDRWNDTIFVKIPHHGSKTSDILPSLYDDAMARTGKHIPYITAVTTSFENYAKIHLPVKTVLDKYLSCARGIYVTKDKATQSSNYGIWTFVYRYNSSVLYRKDHDGDKDVYYEKSIKPGVKRKKR